MKGQFMIISAVIAGLLILSTASIVAETQSQEFSVDETGYMVENIKQEADKVDKSSLEDRQKFRQMLNSLDYQTEVDYWSEEECFNVTLQRPDESLELDCI